MLLDVELDVDRFVRPLADDWGFFHTVQQNLAKLAAFGAVTLEPDPALVLADRVGILSEAMQDFPRSMRWKLRARLGERVPWYDTPEEVE
jgi:hypothetical protein